MQDIHGVSVRPGGLFGRKLVVIVRVTDLCGPLTDHLDRPLSLAKTTYWVDARGEHLPAINKFLGERNGTHA